MNARRDDDETLHELETEVELELTAAEASHPEREMALPVTDWLFDPIDAEREEIGLRGLLDAVEVLEDDTRPHNRPDDRPDDRPR